MILCSGDTAATDKLSNNSLKHNAIYEEHCATLINWDICWHNINSIYQGSIDSSIKF